MNQHPLILVVGHRAMQDNLPALMAADYWVIAAKDHNVTLVVLGSEPVDLILADADLSGLSGYQLYRVIRRNPAWSLIPFVIVLDKPSAQAVRRTRQLGIDEYLVRPVEEPDLFATVNGRLRRMRQLLPGGKLPSAFSDLAPADHRLEKLDLDPLQLDLSKRQVWLQGQSLNLSERELRLLAHLARRANRLVPLAELVKATCDRDVPVQQAGALLRPLIYSLRLKLGNNAGCRIENVYRAGYRLVRQED